jgi:hypothetical protein
MPLSALVEGVGGAVANVVVGPSCYGTARVLLSLITLGWVQGEQSADSGVLRLGVLGGER